MSGENRGRAGFSSPKYATALQIDWKRFGDDLRKERLRRGLTYRQFGALTGVAFSTLARLESSFLPCNAETFMTLTVEMEKDPILYTIKGPPRDSGARAST